MRFISRPNDGVFREAVEGMWDSVYCGTEFHRGQGRQEKGVRQRAAGKRCERGPEQEGRAEMIKETELRRKYTSVVSKDYGGMWMGALRGPREYLALLGRVLFTKNSGL